MMNLIIEYATHNHGNKYKFVAQKLMWGLTAESRGKRVSIWQRKRNKK